MAEPLPKVGPIFWEQVNLCMLPTLTVWGVALDLGLILLLAYVVVLWMGGWALEFLARAHFHRAQRFAHHGFAYDTELDRYEYTHR